MNGTPNIPEAPSPLQQQMRESLVRAHGPLLGGDALISALGHRSAASLRQARSRGQVTVPLFTVPNRRGMFALTLDVADWLASLRHVVPQQDGGISPP